MIIAGIDEAGYGPLLGPLVVGCAAFEVDSAFELEGGIAVCLVAVEETGVQESLEDRAEAACE